MPRAAKPADPIFSGMAVDGTPAMPGLMSLGQGHNSVNHGIELARGVRSIEFLDRQIDALNTQKSAVYVALAGRGYSKAAVKEKIKELKADPIIRAEKKLRDEAYSRVIDDGLAQIAMEEEVAAAALEAEAAE